MKENVSAVLRELTARYPSLRECEKSVADVFALLAHSFRRGGKLLLCGNGGSAADCEHIVGELMKSFKFRRPLEEGKAQAFQRFGKEGMCLFEGLEEALPAISLASSVAISTAFANDRCFEYAFAQQVFGLGKEGDVLFAVSTTGNSKNCVYAAMAAKAKGMAVIGLTGMRDSRLASLADAVIRVPETETFKVQELHLPVYHCLCAMLEEEFFHPAQV